MLGKKDICINKEWIESILFVGFKISVPFNVSTKNELKEHIWRESVLDAEF